MTFNSFYNGIVSNLFFGGIAAALLIFVMFRKANQVAASGNRAKMVGWSLAPSIMVIVAVLAHGAALNVVWPRIQGAFASAPVQNTVAMGSQVTAAIDSVLWGGGGMELAANVGPGAFAAPVQNTSNSAPPAPLLNEGRTASFVSNPAPITANREVQVMTNAQAVAAIVAFDATPTPNGVQQANQFVVANTGGTYTVQRGDSLAKIAAKYGVSAAALCAANRTIIRDCNIIRVGWVLTIPVGGVTPTNAIVAAPTAIPQSWGQQTTTYRVQPTAIPVYVQSNQQASVQRNLATGQVVISSNADAVQAVQALGPLPTVPPVVAVAPTPTVTPRAVTTYAELKAQQGGSVAGGGQAYIDQFLKEQKNTTMADAGGTN